MMKRIILVLLMMLVCGVAQAQEVVEKLEYPILADTFQEKLEFCYIAQEKLRLEHNKMGQDYRDGKITKEEWNTYLKDEFEPKQELIIQDLLIQKRKMLKSTKYEVDLNALEKTIISP